MNPARNHEVMGSIPGLAQWAKDLALLWLRNRQVAITPIGPLAWKPPYAEGVTQKKKKKKKRKKERKKQSNLTRRNMLKVL